MMKKELDYTSTQKEIAASVRRIATKYDRKYMLKQIEDGSPFPQELWDEVAKAGYLGTTIPERYGGSDLGYDDLRVFYNELSKHGIATLHFIGNFMDSIIDILRNYRRPILMTDSNPVHSGNKSIQIKSRRHHHPEIDQPGDDRRHIVVSPEPIPEYTPHDLELLHPSDRVFYDHSRSIELLIVSFILLLKNFTPLSLYRDS